MLVCVPSTQTARLPGRKTSQRHLLRHERGPIKPLRAVLANWSSTYSGRMIQQRQQQGSHRQLNLCAALPRTATTAEDPTGDLVPRMTPGSLTSRTAYPAGWICSVKTLRQAGRVRLSSSGTSALRAQMAAPSTPRGQLTAELFLSIICMRLRWRGSRCKQQLATRIRHIQPLLSKQLQLSSLRQGQAPKRSEPRPCGLPGAGARPWTCSSRAGRRCTAHGIAGATACPTRVRLAPSMRDPMLLPFVRSYHCWGHPRLATSIESDVEQMCSRRSAAGSSPAASCGR